MPGNCLKARNVSDYMEHMTYMLSGLNMLPYWYPRASLFVKTPRTQIVFINREVEEGETMMPNKATLYGIEVLARDIGYPLFLRTDGTSGKHEFLRSCYVPSADELREHIYHVLVDSDLKDLYAHYIVLREYIKPKYVFKAFRGLPIGYEVRVFIHDKKIQCWHYYWPEESIKFYKTAVIEPETWREELREVKEWCEGEGWETLRPIVEKLADHIGGHDYWSLDFMLGEDGDWYFIDAALGEVSYHPEVDRR